MRLRWLALALGLLWTSVECVSACSLCANLRQTHSLREDAAEARAILLGTVVSSQLAPGGGGSSELRIEIVLKGSVPKGTRSITLPRFLPIADPANPPRHLLFLSVVGNRQDAFRGVPLRSAALLSYVRGFLAIPGDDRPRLLRYYAEFLEHDDPDIAADAFLEFAKAGDAEIGAVAGSLSAEKLRRYLRDPRIAAERVGLYAFLLGACGSGSDAATLKEMAREPGERPTAALDGILAGLIRLQPEQGWALLQETLRNDRNPFTVRYAALRTLRFYHGWKPAESRLPILQGMSIAVRQGDLADLAIEDLRRWQQWELTSDVVEQFGKPGYDGPVVREAIARFALSSPRPEAAALVGRLRQQEPQLVRDAEDALRREKSGK